MPRPSEVNTSDTRWRYTKAKTYEPYEEAHLQPYGSRIFLHDGLRHSTKTVQEEFTSSVGLRPRVGKTNRGIARGIYFVSRPAASCRENEARNRKRNLLRQSDCGLVWGKRSEELQDDTSSLGLAHQSVFPDRAVAPASNAPPFRLPPAPSPAPADPGSMPRPSEVNTSGRRWRYTKRKPSKEVKASSPAPCPINTSSRTAR